MLGFNGGLLGQPRTPTPQSTQGSWTLNEQSMLRRSQLWPSSSISYRFWRWSGISVNSTLLEISEWRLSSSGSPVNGGSWSFIGSNFQNINVVRMADGIVDGGGDGSAARALQITSSNLANHFIIYDHGSIVAAQGWQYAQFFGGGARFVTAVNIEGSYDGVKYFPVASFSGLSQYATSDKVLSPLYQFAL